jgi:tetratricopeptide (TPR) repeat protein
MLHRRFLRERLLLLCLLQSCVWQFAHSQSNPAQPINLNQIETSIQQGKLDQVEKPLLDYAIAHPRDVRALELLAQIRYQQRRLEEVQALYQRVLALDPSLIRVKISLLRLLYELGQQEAARQLLGEIEATPEINVSERLALARVMALMGEFNKALTAADKLPDAVRNNAALPLRAASYLGLGEQRKIDSLLPAMKRAAVSNPEIARECAEILRKVGKPQEAAELLRFALARAPNNFSLLISLGQIETQAGNLEAARKHLSLAAKVKPNTVDSLYSVAMLQSAEGNYEAALSTLRKARALDPHSTLVLSQFILNAIQANQSQMAVDAANELLVLEPNEPEFLYLFGAASLQHGSLATARDALERYRKQRPDDPRGCLALGITLAGQPGQQQEAKSQFEQCLKLDSRNVEPKYQLGLIYKSEGDVQKAIQMFEEVVTPTSKHANAMRDLGALYLQTGSEAKARAILERAVALNPEDPETHFLLSRLYNLIGESNLARQHLGLFQKLKGEREKSSRP